MLLTVSYNINAQPDIVWKSCYGGSRNDHIEDSKKTDDGGYILVGSTESDDGDITVNQGKGDIWVVKTDAAGNIEWQQTYGSDSVELGRAIETTSDGGYIVLAERRYTFGAPGVSILIDRILLLKLDSKGNVEWEKLYGGSGPDFARDVCLSDNGGYVIAGTTHSSDGDMSSNNGGPDMWVVETDAKGKIVWQHSWGGSSPDHAEVITKAQNGGYIVGGRTTSDDGDVGKSYGGQDVWILKLSDKGQVEWKEVYGGTNYDVIADIQSTIDGGYVFTGMAYTDNNYPQQLGMLDAYVTKISRVGQKLWTAVHGSTDDEEFRAIYQKPDGNYIVTGTKTDGDADVWVAELFGDGSMNWSKTMGSSYIDYARNIIVSNDGILVSGATNGNDQDVTGTGYHGNLDWWVVKLESTLSIGAKQQEQEIKVYPTVTNGKVNISLGDQKDAEVYLLNMNGQILYKDNSHQSERVVNLQTYASGAYFIKVVSSSFIKTCKVIYAR